MRLEFIHCGDLHLGCNPNRLEERFNDFFDAFLSVVSYAIEHHIKLLLISGDLFHLKAINSKTLQRTIEVLDKARKHEIEVVAIEGNHDKAFYVDEDSWLAFLNQQGYLKLLTPAVVEGRIKLSPYQDGVGSILSTQNMRIIGLGYFGGTTERYLKEIVNQIKKSDQFTILMLHAAVGRLGGQDLGDVDGEEIISLKNIVDYVALGHIHNRYEYDNFCFNPGALENIRIRDGRTFEKKGFYHVVVENNEISAKHIQSKTRPVKFESINADGFFNPLDLEEDLKTRTYDVQAGDQLEINLYGKVEFNPFLIDFNKVTTAIKERYHLVHIEVNNKINLQTKESASSEEVDLEAMVLELVEEDLKIHHPLLENKKKLAAQMIQVGDWLNDGMDPTSIIGQMKKWGEEK